MFADVPDVIQIADFESELGTIRVASSDHGLAFVGLPRADGRGLMGWLRRHSPDAIRRKDVAANRRFIEQLRELLSGARESFDLPFDLRATPFQERVYRATLEIPFGETRSYREVAEAAGAPRAQRAVGAALGANPLPLVIPCHRVIGSHGKLQGYAGGLDIKARLLAGERPAQASGQLF